MFGVCGDIKPYLYSCDMSPCSLEPGGFPPHRSWQGPGPGGTSRPPDSAMPLRAATGTFLQRLKVSLKTDPMTGILLTLSTSTLEVHNLLCSWGGALHRGSFRLWRRAFWVGMGSWARFREPVVVAPKWLFGFCCHNAVKSCQSKCE